MSSDNAHSSSFVSDDPFPSVDSDFVSVKAEYSDSHDTAGAKLWSVYVSEAEKYDKALVDSWKSDMEGLLIFAGLFSAILTAFLIESYKTLTPDSGDDMKALLTQISTQLSGIANGSSVDIPAPESFVPATSSLLCNLLWFISLGFSLSCALIATLVEQWARDFKYKTEMRSAPVIRARIFSYLYYGLKRFNMHAVVEIIPFLLHASLILFFAGLVAFLVPVNKAVMISVIILLGIVVIAYTTLTVFPLFSSQSPYQTPLSTGLWRAIQFIRSIWQSASERNMLPTSLVDAMNKAALENSVQRAHRDYRALSWTLGSLSDDVELEPFLEGIVHALASTEYSRSPYNEPIRWLLQNRILRLERVQEFLYHCESKILPLETQTRRQLIALKALWAMAIIPAKDPTNHWLGPNPIQLIPLWLNRFHFVCVAAGPTQLPQVVHGHQLSAHAMLRLNVFLTAMGTVDKTVGFLNDYQRRTREGNPLFTIVTSQSIQELIPQYILEPLHALLVSPLWTDRRLHEFGIPRTEWDMNWDIIPLRNCILWDSTGTSNRAQWLAECLASLNSLRQRLIRMGHEHFLDFMVCAARLESPPYEFHRTECMLSGNLVYRETTFPTTTTTLYSEACAIIVNYHCRVHKSYQPYIDTILVTLLKSLAKFKKTSPNSGIHWPTSLARYISQPFFDRTESHVLRYCDKWWLCRCLTMDLASAGDRAESTERIIGAIWDIAYEIVFPEEKSPSFVFEDTPTYQSQFILG
ncbi:hypothetical protein R3P38DRAFT_765881, partial [Favolaschia claudopus]